MYKNLPDLPLQEGEISALFKQKSILTFHQACDYIWRLKYGRTSDPYNFRLVLSENAGTCSSKHAVLKLLADELKLDVDLILGLYPMKESNTPGVGQVLSNNDFDYVPEAHCYLMHNGNRIDLTRYEVTASETIETFFMEVVITPEILATEKSKIHRQFLKDHYGVNNIDFIWKVREECIAALSD